MKYITPERYKKDMIRFIRWLQSNQKHYSTSTINDTLRRIRRLMHHIDLTKEDLEYYALYFHREMENGRSRIAINSDIKAINRWFKFMGWNIELREYRTRKQGAKKVPNKEQVKKILKAEWKNPGETARNRLILKLLTMGLRVSEVASLNIEDIETNIIHIRESKSGASRDVHIKKKLYDEIQRYIRLYRIHSDAKALFTTRQGRITTKTIRKIVKDAGKIAGVEWLHPHALRHYAAMRLVLKNYSLRLIQEYLGHKDIKTTQIYIEGLKLNQEWKEKLEKIDILTEVET